MPPPQRLLSPNTERVSRRCAERPWGLRFSGTLFLHVVILALLLLPLSAPSKTAAAPGESSPPWANSSSWSHWAIPDDEVCPSARAWVTRPGSFCTTLWTSPYLSNRTELESRERRAVQIYCELDVILERFDCGQEYSVNVKRGQCQLCRQAYREWVCAVVADTTADGSLDCATKLMPCPSCASICHQVMRLCPYLSPDRIQFDLLGQPSPQVSQYGGHPAFYCPLENDDPSDPAYTTSLCLAPQEDDDPDHVHNICTNPPLGLSLGGRIHTHQFHHLHHHHHHRRTRRDQTYDDDTDYTTPRPNHHPPPYDYGGGGGGGYDSYDDDTATSSSPIPMHYTTCCWTYASSLVIFDATKDYPNYGSDAFFSTTLTIFDNATTRNSSNLSSTTTTTTTPSSPLFPTKKTATTSRRPTTGPPPTTTSLPTTKYANSSSAEGADDPTENRVILNCCNSHGECSAVDGDEEEEDGGGEDLSSSSPPSPPDDDVFPPRPPIQEIKSDPQLVKFSVKNRKRSSERREISENDNQEDVGSGLLLEGDLSPSSSSSSSSSSPPASSSVLSLPPLFFKTIDLPPNPTHISQVEEDVEYDEHYMDTEPDQQQGEGSTSTERLLEHVVLDDELEEDDDLEEDIDDEEEVSEVEDLLRQVKKKVVIKATTGRPGILLGGNKKVIKNRASVQLFPSSKKDAFMSIVIGHRGGGGGDEHVLDRADHHPQTAAALLLKKRIIPTRHFLHGEIPLKTRHNDDESFTFADNTISSSRQQDNHVAERVTRQERSSSSPPAKRPPTLLELFTYFTFLSSSSLVTPISLLIFVFTVATSVVAVAHVTLMLANLVAATSPCSTTTSLCWGTSFLVLLISAVVLWISTRFHFLSDWWGGSTLSWWWSGGGVKLKKYCVHRLLFYGEGGGGGGCWIPEKVASFLLLLFFSGRNQKLSPPTTKTRLDSSADIAKKLGNNYDSNSASVQSSLQLSSSSRRRDYYCLLFTNRQDKDTNRDVKKYCTSKKISRLAMEKYQCCYYCHHRHEWGCDPVGDGRRRGKENDDNNCTSRKKRRRKQLPRIFREKIFTIFVIDCCRCHQKNFMHRTCVLSRSSEGFPLFGGGFNLKFLKLRNRGTAKKFELNLKLLLLLLLLIQARLLIVFKFIRVVVVMGTLSYRSEGGEKVGRIFTPATTCSPGTWQEAWVKLRRITSRPCSIIILIVLKKIHGQSMDTRRRKRTRTTSNLQLLLLMKKNTWTRDTWPSITITTTLSDSRITTIVNYLLNIPSKKSRDKFLVQFQKQQEQLVERFIMLRFVVVLLTVKKRREKKECCQKLIAALSSSFQKNFQKLLLLLLTCYYYYYYTYRPKGLTSFSKKRKKMMLSSGSLSRSDKKRLLKFHFSFFFQVRGQSDTLVELGDTRKRTKDGHKFFKVGQFARAPLKLLWAEEIIIKGESESKPIFELPCPSSCSKRTRRTSSMRTKSEISNVLLVLKKWCSRSHTCNPNYLTRKAAAGFEIHPLIKL